MQIELISRNILTLPKISQSQFLVGNSMQSTHDCSGGLWQLTDGPSTEKLLLSLPADVPRNAF